MKKPNQLLPGTALSGLWKKINEALSFSSSLKPVAGRGMTATQTSGGISLNVKKHAATHLATGSDPLKFESLTLDGVSAEGDSACITLDPAAADFAADSVLAVDEEGTGTAWRTLLDLMDGLDGFAASLVLAVNAAGDALEWTPGGVGDVVENLATPFQSGKLVIASGTAKELMGTLMGINTRGSDYAGFSDSDVGTEARAAVIADNRFYANFPSSNIVGTGVDGQIATFVGGTNSLGSATLQALLLSAFGTSSPAQMLYADASGYQLGGPVDVGAIADPDGSTHRALLYYDGAAWSSLAPPTVSTDQVLTCDGGTQGLRWADASGGDIPATETVADYKVLQVQSGSTVWDYVRAH